MFRYFKRQPHPALATLDPHQDFETIVFISSLYEFPIDLHYAMQLALFRTFASPSIAQRLKQTRQFTEKTQKRNDDTELMLSLILENGIDSAISEKVIQRMNEIHQRFNISNEDYLYVLSTFIFEPIRWNKRFAWRPLTDKEIQAGFLFWQKLGKKMHINDIPTLFRHF